MQRDVITNRINALCNCMEIAQETMQAISLRAQTYYSEKCDELLGTEKINNANN